MEDSVRADHPVAARQMSTLGPGVEHVRSRLIMALSGFAMLFGMVAYRLIDLMVLHVQRDMIPEPAAATVFSRLQWGIFFGNAFAIYWLYRFRCRRLRAYGVIEVCIGIFTALLIANQMAGAEIDRVAFLLLAQIGGLYVAVRGLDNIHKALDGRIRHEWERHFYGR